MKIQPRHIRHISLGAALLTALPVSLGAFTGFHLWLSPFILLNSALALKTLVFFNIFGIVVLIAAFLKDRWFCRYLCPTGLLCDLTAKYANKKTSGMTLPLLNKPLAVVSLLLSLFGIPVLAFLDPINAFYNFFKILHPALSIILLVNVSGLLFILLLNLISPGSWCSRICPLGGLQLLLTSARKFLGREKRSDAVPAAGRRNLLTGLLGGGLGLTFMFYARRIKASPLFRPPGSLPEEQLKVVCIRCGNCVKACPTDIIKSAFDAGDLTGIMIPELDFSLSYCLPECTACGDVCPSGAITAFSRDQKKQLFIGTVEIDPDKCLLTHNKECNQCKLACAYDAIDITSRGNNLTPLPEIEATRCVGCAACKIVCPPGAIAIKKLSRLSSQASITWKGLSS
jgi:ferredoxin-type protein NapF